MESFFKKKVGGLPVGVWLLIILAGIAVGLYIRRRSLQAEGASGPDDEGFSESDYAETVPYDSLTSEDYGDYPMTGGGPPVVYGGGAIRLQPGTLRIKLVYPKTPHKCPPGKHWSKQKKKCVPN